MKTDNELIAEFMGYKVRWACNTTTYNVGKASWPLYTKDGKTTDTVFYDTSWDWLMPVALKIKHLTFKDLKAQELPTFQQASARWRAVQNEISNLKIEAAHYCIVKWIEWYNAQPK